MSQQPAHSGNGWKIAIQSKEINIDDRICIRDFRKISIVPKICFLSAAFLGFFILGALCNKFIFRSASYSIADYDSKNNTILPRQTSTLTDFGHSTRFHGWIDIQNQGVPNDYARYVGPNNEYPFVWFSIALAGSTQQHTQPGLYEELSGIVKRTLIKPRQIIPDIDKLGLPNHFKGWVDVQNQGVTNDYAYYVGATDDIPFPWLTVALGGSSQPRTCAGLFVEKYGIVRPTLGAIYYNQSIDISCQYVQSKIRELIQSSSNYDSYKFNSFLSYSRSDTQQAVAENLIGEDTSSTTAVSTKATSI